MAKHCVAYTHGAAIYNEYSNSKNLKINYKVLTKGTDSKKEEEYSVFLNDESYDHLTKTVAKNIDQIDICGIAGDVCVHDTLVSGINELETRNLIYLWLLPMYK